MSRERTFEWDDIEYASPEYYRRWRLANSEHSRAYHRKYDSKMYKKHPERERARRERYRLKYPERIKANQKVSRAVNKGMLIKQPCEVCQESKVIAHHDNYDKPLDVKWLCELHHKARHRTISSHLC